MAPTPEEGMEPVQCCNVPRDERSEHCFPIPVPEFDTIFTECMEFVRSHPALDQQGRKIVPREQINGLTSFIDASSIYGEDHATLMKLRTFNGKGAMLKTRKIDGKYRLPTDIKSDCLKTKHPKSYCQLSGDTRVNEQPGLSSLHLVFHLQHNTIVTSLAWGILKKRRPWINPGPQQVSAFIRRATNDVKEKLFQEARKIVSAIFQKVTFCDWLPLVLGEKLIRRYNLTCDQPMKYNPKVDPRIANAFMSAAYRFGHTLIPNEFLVKNQMHSLGDMFNIPDHTILNFESIVSGMCEAKLSRNFDRFFSKSVTTDLFRTSGKFLDLVSLNIQRGRDHGIPSYHFWREKYGLRPFTRWSQFGSVKIARSLQTLFRDPKDVDLFTAGILEKSVDGGIVGETFGQIIANQFSDLKFGDAFFFLSTEKPQGFTPGL